MLSYEVHLQRRQQVVAHHPLLPDDGCRLPLWDEMISRATVTTANINNPKRVVISNNCVNNNNTMPTWTTTRPHHKAAIKRRMISFFAGYVNTFASFQSFPIVPVLTGSRLNKFFFLIYFHFNYWRLDFRSVAFSTSSHPKNLRS